MPDLFGLDIAGIINDSIGAAGGVRPGTLTHITAGTRGATLIDGTNPSDTTHTISGFAETRQIRREDSLVGEPVAVVSILGASITPAVVPDVGDLVTIDGREWTLLALMNRDPAAALYEFRAEE